MIKFKTFFLALSADERERFARDAGTTVGYCNKLIYGGARVELGLADLLVAASHGDLVHADVPMTDRATEQIRRREAFGHAIAAEASV